MSDGSKIFMADLYEETPFLPMVLGGILLIAFTRLWSIADPSSMVFQIILYGIGAILVLAAIVVMIAYMAKYNDTIPEDIDEKHI